MPSTTDNTTTTLSKFWTIYEVLVVVFFLPTAFGINKIIYITAIPSDPPFWVLPAILGFIIGLALLISTPKHPWTPVTFALELTGITEITLIYNSGALTGNIHFMAD